AQARRKDKRRRDSDEECGLKLDDEVRLANEGQRYFHHTRSFAFQLQVNVVIHNARETALKKLQILHRLFRPDFRRASSEAHVIGSLLQSAVHDGRTDFQGVHWPAPQFLNIENDAQLLADALTIRMRNLWI